MADNFGLKIGVEGEKEFKSALYNINQSFKVLGSEMKLVESQFSKNDNSIQSLTARNQVLNKEIDTQKQKIDLLKNALNNSSQSFGENDRRTQEWQIKLNNATAELNSMEKELKDNQTALEAAGTEMDDVSKSADKMGSDINEAGKKAEDSNNKFEKLGSVLKGIGATMGAVAVAAGAAAVALAKKVVSSYGEFEQLEGGVKTLFGTEATSVEEYAKSVGKNVSEVKDEYNSLLAAQKQVFSDANNAYKTAGLSANQYMETVTSFSASLISSLNGDTEASAKAANQAIIDMSDNANKMGTDMSLIQSAYQGFAKQNYTMLDNLKLGYGGTKTEMERLLKDAEKISGIKYDISNLNDVYSAIHVIQTEMGITGTTANEAEKTIAGSANALKGAFENLIAGFGNSSADIQTLCKNVADSLSNVIKNITPVIQNIISVLPIVVDSLMGAIVQMFPTLLESITGLFSDLVETILTLIPELVPTVITALTTIIETLVENLPLLMEAIVVIFTSLIEGIGELLPTLIPTAVQAIITIVNGLIENLPMLLNAALQLITGLAQGLITALPILIQALPGIINGIVTFLLDSIPQIIETGISLLTSLIEALPEIITTIVEAIPQIIDGLITAILDSIPLIIQAGIDLLISLIQALPQIITTIVNAIPKIISGIVNAVIGNIDKIIMAGVQLFVALIKNLPQIIVEIVKAVPQIVSGLVEAFKSGIGSMASVGKNLIQGLWNGISNAKDWVLNKIKGFGDSILKGIKSFFGIHSPSRVFRDEIGSNLALGLGEGFTKEMNSVSNMMEDSIPTDFNVGMNANVDSLDFNNNSYSKDNLVTAFQQALSGMTIKISEDLFGELVIDKVEKVVYG